MYLNWLFSQSSISLGTFTPGIYFYPCADIAFLYTSSNGLKMYCLSRLWVLQLSKLAEIKNLFIFLKLVCTVDEPVLHWSLDHLIKTKFLRWVDQKMVSTLFLHQRAWDSQSILEVLHIPLYIERESKQNQGNTLKACQLFFPSIPSYTLPSNCFSSCLFIKNIVC